jgi:transposase-like protein
LALPFFQFESFYHGRFGLDRQSITRDVIHQKKAPFQYSASIFIAHTWNSIYQIKRNIIKILLLLLNILGFRRIMRSVHHLQIILKERLNPYAKAVNFTFDNSNIR